MKGVYVLVISVDKDVTVNVGSLGSVNFERGLYAYVGSAQNSIEKRVERHLRKAKRKFWHVDYLLDNDAVEVLKVFYEETGKREECKIAERASEEGKPMQGFGSSDCKCKGHLIKIRNSSIKTLRMLEYSSLSMRSTENS